MVRASFPLRAVTLGLQATSALVGASVHTAASAAGSLGTVASTGLTMAAIPVREGVKALSEGLPAPTLTRHSWRGRGRAWIEVRGLDGPDGAELGRVVVDAVRARSGVKSVSVNRPLSRIVVTLTNDQISLRELCRDVDEAEKRWRASGSVEQRRSDTRPKPLPGDGLLLATNALGVGATAVGVGAAVAGRLLRWPRLFDGVEAVVVAVDYQPRLRRLLEDDIGHSATDAVLSVAMVVAHVLELSPASLAVDLAMEILKAAEYQAEAQAWRRHEPALARHAEHPEVHPPSRPVPLPEGPVERHARRSALVQVIGNRGGRRLHPQPRDGFDRGVGHHAESHPHHPRVVRRRTRTGIGRAARGVAAASGKAALAGPRRRAAGRSPGVVHQHLAGGARPRSRRGRALSRMEPRPVAAGEERSARGLASGPRRCPGTDPRPASKR